MARLIAVASMEVRPPAPADPIPAPLLDLLETSDPTLPYVTKHLVHAALIGENVTEAHIVERCLRDGRTDYLNAPFAGALDAIPA